MNRLHHLVVLCFTLLFVAASTSAHAAAPPVRRTASAHKNGVVVTCSCSDETGLEYASALRNALSKSSQYHEVSFQQGVDSNAIRISIVSMPVEAAAGKSKAALSIVCLHDGVILHQFIETCVDIPIQDCAEQMLTHIMEWEQSNT